MNIWAVWPSAEPSLREENIKRWQKMGYRVAISDGEDCKTRANRFVKIVPYKGYAHAINVLIAAVSPDIVVAGSDDVWPDPDHTAQEIAAMFMERFPDMDGLMQPNKGNKRDPGLVKAPWAISAWLGWRFIDRVPGPYHEGYFHVGCDAEILGVARKRGVVWVNNDLAQFHNRWNHVRKIRRPAHLAGAYAHKKADLALYCRRRDAGWVDYE